MTDQNNYLTSRLRRLQHETRKEYEESGREKLDEPKIVAAAAKYAEDQTANHSSGYQSNDSAPEESNEEFVCAQVSENLGNMMLNDNRLWHEEVDEDASAELLSQQANAPPLRNHHADNAVLHWTQKNARNILLENRNDVLPPKAEGQPFGLKHSSLAPENPTSTNYADEWPCQVQWAQTSETYTPNDYQLFGEHASLPTTVSYDQDYDSTQQHDLGQWQQTSAKAPAPQYTFQDRRQFDGQLTDARQFTQSAQPVDLQPFEQQQQWLQSVQPTDLQSYHEEQQWLQSAQAADLHLYDEQQQRWAQSAQSTDLPLYKQQQFADVASQPSWKQHSDGHGQSPQMYREPVHEVPAYKPSETAAWLSPTFDDLENNTDDRAQQYVSPTVVSVATALSYTMNSASRNNMAPSCLPLTSPTPSAGYDGVISSYPTDPEFENCLLKTIEPCTTTDGSPKYQIVDCTNVDSSLSLENQLRHLHSHQPQVKAYLILEPPLLSEVDVSKPPPVLPSFLNNKSPTDTQQNSANTTEVSYIHQTEAMHLMKPSSAALLHHQTQYNELPTLQETPSLVPVEFQRYARQQTGQSDVFCAQLKTPESLHGEAPLSEMRYLNMPLPPSPPQGATPDMLCSEMTAHQQMTSGSSYMQPLSLRGETSVNKFKGQQSVSPVLEAPTPQYGRQPPFNPTFGTDDARQPPFNPAFETTIDEFTTQRHATVPATSSPPLCATAQVKYSQPGQTTQSHRTFRSTSPNKIRPAFKATSTPDAPESVEVTPTNSLTDVRKNSLCGSGDSTNGSKSAQITPTNLPNGMRKDAQRGSNSRYSKGSDYSTPRDQRYGSGGGRFSAGSGGPGSGNRSMRRPSFSPEEENELSTALKESYGYSLEALLERCFSKRDSFAASCSLRSTRYSNNAEDMFTSALWSKEYCSDLVKLKDRLNAVKERLSSYELNEWHRHTRTTNPADMVMRRLRSDVKVEFLTQAWCKFYELVDSFNLVPRDARNNNELYSVHLCEAPGAFVASLNHYLRLNHPKMRWSWKANSLNPYYEGNHLSAMINDDRFMLQTIENWDFGPDMTGDIMHPGYPDHLRNVCGEHLPHLVTADGSFDCQDKPEEQEKLVSWLHLKEALTAIRILRKGGHFVIKMFTFFECESVCLLFLLQCMFQSIDIMKPATSKEGNSEVYVVCREFKDERAFEPFIRHLLTIDQETHSRFAMFPFERIPRQFMHSVVNCATKFAVFQTEVIERNIRLYQHQCYDVYRRHFEFVQEKLFERYVHKYRIKQIPLNETVVRMPYRRSENRFAVLKVLEQREHKQQGSHEDQLKRSSLQKKELVRVIAEELSSFPQHQLHNSVSTVPRVELTLRDFEIRCGKPIHTITSSQFCHGTLIRVRNELMNTINHKKYYIAAAEMEKSADMENDSKKLPNICDFASSLMMMKNYNDTQREIFVKLYDRLASLEKHEKLTLFCFPLLTQFNISILCILNQIFNEINFEPPNILYLCNQDRKNYELWMPKLKKIHETYTKEKAIISFLPIKKITGSSNPFYSWVIEANNSQIIREIQLFSSYHS